MVFWNSRRKRKRRSEHTSLGWQLFYGVLVLLCATLLGTLVWYGTRLPQVTLDTITVEGGETISHEEVQRIVERELQGNYFFLVPKRFTYTYPRERIRTQVSNIPRIHNVTLKKSTRTELKVSFSEYTPFALWCDRVDEFSPCVFLSEGGYAFAAAPALRGSAFMRFTTEGRAATVGETVFDNTTLGDTLALLEVLDRELSFRVHTVTLTEDGDLELHLSEMSRLLVSSELSMQHTFENLQSILQSDAFDHLEPGNFNYIDLRFGNKVFVNEEFPEKNASSSASSTGESFEIEFE